MKTLTGMFAVAVTVIGILSVSPVVLPSEAVAQQSKKQKYVNDCRRYTPGSAKRVRCDCAFSPGVGGYWTAQGGFIAANGGLHSNCVMARLSPSNSSESRQR